MLATAYQFSSTSAENLVFIQVESTTKQKKYELPDSYMPPLRHIKKKKNNPNSQEGNKQNNGSMCLMCGTKQSPQWRRGPGGSKSLCNACGLRFQSMMRQERKISPVYKPTGIPIAALLNPVCDY